MLGDCTGTCVGRCKTLMQKYVLNQNDPTECDSGEDNQAMEHVLPDPKAFARACGE